MFRPNRLIFAILSVSLLAISVSAQKTPKLLTFDDLADYNAENQTFRIVGYLLDIYKCPPCPPRAMCKPCIPQNITIVQKIDRDQLSTLHRLRIETDDIDKFASGEKYEFTVRVFGTPQEHKPITDVTLVSFERLASDSQNP